MTDDVHSSPDPTDDPEQTGIAAWLFGRGAWGTSLWFALLAGLLITLVLIANQCTGDDNDGADGPDTVAAVQPTAAPTAAPEPEPTATLEPEATATPEPEPTATPEPEPTAAPEPEATATPEPEPDATGDPAALTPFDVTMDVAGDGIILTGSVPDQDSATQLEAAATTLVGLGNVVNDLEIDPATTAEAGVVRLTGETDDAFAADLAEAIAGLLPDTASLDQSGLSVVATTDIVAELNELFEANPIQFETGSASILPASQDVLDQVASKLNEFPAVALTIEGHTDNTGDPSANVQLSEARAEAVKSDLVARGVADTRLDTVGKGDAEPVADNNTEEGRQQNRRIEFSIENG